MQKKILLVSRHAPYGSHVAKEALEAALAAAVYDQDLSLLFMDDGVFQLICNQAGDKVKQKTISAMLPALSLYGVEKVFVHKESLEQRRIQSNELAIKEVALLNNSQVGALLRRQDHVLSF